MAHAISPSTLWILGQPGQSRLSVSKNKAKSIKQQRQSGCYNKSGEEILFWSAGNDKPQVVFRWIKNCAKPVRKWPETEWRDCHHLEESPVVVVGTASPSHSRGPGPLSVSTEEEEWITQEGEGEEAFGMSSKFFHSVSPADGDGINKVRGTDSGADRREKRSIPHLEIQVPGTSFAKTIP